MIKTRYTTSAPPPAKPAISSVTNISSSDNVISVNLQFANMGTGATAIIPTLFLKIGTSSYPSTSQNAGNWIWNNVPAGIYPIKNLKFYFTYPTSKISDTYSMPTNTSGTLYHMMPGIKSVNSISSINGSIIKVDLSFEYMVGSNTPISVALKLNGTSYTSTSLTGSVATFNNVPTGTYSFSSFSFTVNYNVSKTVGNKTTYTTVTSQEKNVTTISGQLYHLVPSITGVTNVTSQLPYVKVSFTLNTLDTPTSFNLMIENITYNTISIVANGSKSWIASIPNVPEGTYQYNKMSFNFSTNTITINDKYAINYSGNLTHLTPSITNVNSIYSNFPDVKVSFTLNISDTPLSFYLIIGGITYTATSIVANGPKTWTATISNVPSGTYQYNLMSCSFADNKMSYALYYISIPGNLTHLSSASTVSPSLFKIISINEYRDYNGNGWIWPTADPSINLLVHLLGAAYLIDILFSVQGDYIGTYDAPPTLSMKISYNGTIKGFIASNSPYKGPYSAVVGNYTFDGDYTFFTARVYIPMDSSIDAINGSIAPFFSYLSLKDYFFSVNGGPDIQICTTTSF
jgi:hypothetical protein